MRIFLQLLLLLPLFISAPAFAQTQDGWKEYRDEDGVFQALVPDTYRINKKFLRIGTNRVAMSTELTATVDQRPYKSVVKQYIIKYDQTLSSFIAENDIGNLIATDVKKYIDYYDSIGGVLRQHRNGLFSGFPGTEFLISYNDEKMGLQTVRANIIYTQTSRVEQVAIGPDDSMFDFRTDAFFDSLSVRGGRTNYEGDFEGEWLPLTMPSEIFTIMIPPVSPPYVLYKPQVKAGSKREEVNLVFKDPVYNQTMYYNVYSYRFANNLSMSNVQLVLHENHLKKYRANPKNVSYGSAQVEMPGKINGWRMSTTTGIPAPEETPYMNTLKLNIYFQGPFLVVQELVGDNAQVQSSFSQNIMDMITVDPKRAIEALRKNRFQEKLQDLRESGEESTTEGEEDDIPLPEDPALAE